MHAPAPQPSTHCDKQRSTRRCGRSACRFRSERGAIPCGRTASGVRDVTWNTAVRTIVACAILIVLHYTLRPLLAWRASIDFLVIALLIGSVRLRPGAAAMYGFFLGF